MDKTTAAPAKSKNAAKSMIKTTIKGSRVTLSIHRPSGRNSHIVLEHCSSRVQEQAEYLLELMDSGAE
jgi:hypothetical protein